jgi:hypothetical protein
VARRGGECELGACGGEVLGGVGVPGVDAQRRLEVRHGLGQRALVRVRGAAGLGAWGDSERVSEWSCVAAAGGALRGGDSERVSGAALRQLVVQLRGETRRERVSGAALRQLVVQLRGETRRE